MTQNKYRVLFVLSQTTQNPVPLQLMAKHPNLEVHVAYLSLPEESKLWHGLENLNKSVFDTPLLDGYAWTYLPNRSPRPRLDRFYGLFNPAIIRLVSQSDCCVVYGHAYLSFWLAILVAKLTRKPLLLTTDSTYLDPLDGGNWKIPLKKIFLPNLYNHVADALLVPSTAAKRYIHSLGVAEDRIFVAPYSVDNEAIARVAQQSDRQATRERWNISQTSQVVIFCAKLIERKRPNDLLEAFAIANVPDSHLVIVGDGPLATSLRLEAKELNVADRVHFLGFVKYSQLPEIYAASDLLVHPAEWEPYGLIVNEAMVCGVPVVVSDRVGAGYDLVTDDVTGFSYPCKNIESLAKILENLLRNPDKLRCMGKNAQNRMQTWSSRENADSIANAIELTIQKKLN